MYLRTIHHFVANIKPSVLQEINWDGVSSSPSVSYQAASLKTDAMFTG